MALFMTLLMRDEADIVDANLRFHLENGVDHIIVTDNLSADGSADIVAPYVKQGVVSSLFEFEDICAQSKWVSRMAAKANAAGAKWVINSDCDEFWIAPEGESLKSWFARQRWPNVLAAARHDFICVEDGDQPFWERMVYRKTRSTNPLGAPLPPKAAHRAAEGLTVLHGNHDVQGFRWKRRRAAEVEILHFPLRSRNQYVRKISQGAKALARNRELSPSIGETWRKQYAELCDRGTTAYADENIVSRDALPALLAARTVVPDRRLADVLAWA